MINQERIFEGIPVSPGIAIGCAHVVNRPGSASLEPHDIAPQDVEREVERFRKAVEVAREQLGRIRSQVAQAIDEKHADIYAAQAMFLEDEALIDHTISSIRAEKKNAEFLFNRRVEEFVTILSQIEDEYFRSRDNDILDVASRVIAHLVSQHPTSLTQSPAPESVLVAHDLPPSQTTLLIKDHVIALVLEKGGPTSHTAIMAKALEIPAVVGVSYVTNFLETGSQIIVDGLDGRIVVNPTEETRARYERERDKLNAFERELEQLRDLPGETLDGYTIEIRANVELPEEVEHVGQHGASGVGLFRTEFIFLNRTHPMTEDEQFEIYRRVTSTLAPQSVVIRTLDVGGDKFFSRVQIAAELNPFMGQRAVRLCLQHPEIFRQQIRAALRASAFGKARLLIPMISGLEEFLEVKKHIHNAKQELRREKIAFDPKIEVGAMIEVPSAALVADTLARECDFFSIGTNDLIQYSLAVDRGNESVAYLYEPLHPAITRLLRMVIKAAHDGGIPVAVCGEVAADPMMAVVLLGLGVDELSMSAVSVAPVKKLIRSITLAEAKVLAEEILAQTTIHGAKQVLRRRLRAYVKRNKVQKTLLSRSAQEPPR